MQLQTQRRQQKKKGIIKSWAITIGNEVEKRQGKNEKKLINTGS